MQPTTLTQKGQVTIPKEIRDYLGLKQGDKIIFEKTEKQVFLKPAEDFFALKGSLKTRKKYNKKKARMAIGNYLAQKYLKKLKK